MMGRLRLFRLASALSLSLLPALGAAQTTLSATAAAPQPQVTMRVERIPEGFRGADWEALAKDFQSKPRPPRGKFETTAEFNARRQRELAIPLADGLPVNAERVFVLPDSITLDYDADRRRAIWPEAGPRQRNARLLPICTESASLITGTSSPPGTAVICKQVLSRLDVRSQEADRFGADFTVTRTAVNTAAITLCAASGAISRCDALTRTRYIPMPVDRARELFDDNGRGVKLAVVGRLAEPLSMALEERSQPPNFEYPYFREERIQLLVVRASGVLIFDGESGEVLLRIYMGAAQEQQPQREQPPQ
jgi:hypothetical protein